MQSELRQHWRLLLAASAGVVCSSIVLPFYTMGALLKPLTEAFGWSRADVQTALVFSTGLSALTAMGVGWLNDRYGPRPVALPGLVGLALAFFFAANMNGKRQIAKPFRARVVGVPRHHRRGRKPICHSGRKLINTITARAVSHEIHTIRINALAHHQIFNEPFEQSIDWGLVPEIPFIAWRAWCNVNTL